ncbi:unnamed protein product [Penicillium viridicatum]
MASSPQFILLLISQPPYGSKSTKLSEARAIPVPNDEQLEQLTRLRVWTTERAERYEWTHRTSSRAINHVDTAMEALKNCY